MALVECRECGRDVSASAETCPHCGIKSPESAPGWSRKTVFAFAALLFVGYCAYQSSESDHRRQEATARAAQTEQARRNAMTPEARADEDKAVATKKAVEKLVADRRETAWRKANLLADAVRKTANDPKSIEVNTAIYTDSGAVAIEYRGKNAFGALIQNRAVMAPDGTAAAGSDKEVSAIWNRHIAGKPYSTLPNP